VYFPMGGGRVSTLRRCFNLMTVFSVSGLWHGASWTYVIWGVLNGLYLVSSILTANLRQAAARLSGLSKLPALQRAFGVFCTFHLILLSWIFFRADSVSRALSVLKGILSWRHGLAVPFTPASGDLVDIAAVLILLVTAEVLQVRGMVIEKLTSRPVALRWAFYGAALSALILLGKFGTNRQFIYFQF
jgi:alginate O-acetyltransferase complex protein AlgI